MAAVVGALRADLETNVVAFKADMNAAGDAVDKTTGRMTKAAKQADSHARSLQNFGKELKGAFAIGAGVAVAAFIKQSIEGAIATEEMAATLKQEFGAMGGSVESWAERTAKELGRVDDELKNSAIQFGKLFEKVVPTQGAAADMSEAMTRLAVDLATFNRVPIDEATDKLQKGLAGSTRGLKEFGILITEQEVAQKAVSMGLARTTKEVSAQDKVLASYNLILEKTANLQGFAATQTETTAGKLRAFQAGIDSLSDNLGAIFLPVLMEVVKWIDLYASGIRTILGDTKEWSDGLMVVKLRMTQAMGGDVQKVIDEFNASHVAIDEVGRAAATNGGIIETEFTGAGKTIAEVNKLLRDLTREARQVGEQVKDFGIPDDPASIKPLTEASDAYNKLSESIRESIETLKDKADRNQDETNQISLLQDALDRLTTKYDDAQEAARGLFFAQGKLNDAKAAAAVQGINDGIDSLSRAGGAMGTQTREQEQLASIERDLARERMAAAVDLLQMEADRALAIRTNDDIALAALNAMLPLQQAYADLLNQTGAMQIQQQIKLQESILDWQASTDQAVGDFFKDLRDHSGAGAKEIAANLIRNISDQVLEQKAQEAVEGLFGFLFGDQGKSQDVQTINAQRLIVADAGSLGGMGGAAASLFGGGAEGAPAGQGGFLGDAMNFLGKTFGGFFAQGGSLQPGQWGIAGEHGAEILRGGAHGMEVDPDGPGAGGPTTQNFIFPNSNADSFRQSRRQVAQVARRELSP